MFNRIRIAYEESLNYWKVFQKERLTPPQKELRKQLLKFRYAVSDRKSDGILLTQLLEDYDYGVQLAAASKVLAQKKNLKVYLYDVHIYQNLGWKTRYETFFEKHFRTAKEKVQTAFGNKVIFKNHDLFWDQNLIKKELDALRASVKTVDDILQIKFQETFVGDLIYDTYIRFYDVPTIEIVDDKLFRIIEIGLNVCYNFKDLLSKKNVKCLLNSYSSYIQHGMSCRLCMDRGIEVYTIGSISYLIQKMTKDFPFHVLDHTSFDPNKVVSEDLRTEIKQLLEARFSGKIDASISYMTVSSFNDRPLAKEVKDLFELRTRNVVIYAHEFQDTPHENRLLQFPDLYQHLKQSLDSMVTNTNTSVFVKLHPASQTKSKQYAIDLVKSYELDHFIILDENVSNKHIITLKPDLIATVWGSVGLEMSYHRIPVIVLYDCLYMNFDFVQTCYSLKEYYSFLAGEQLPEITFDREQIYSFYYQLFFERTINDVMHKDNVFQEISVIKDHAFSDDYITKVLQTKFFERTDELLAYYETKVDIEDKKRENC